MKSWRHKSKTQTFTTKILSTGNIKAHENLPNWDFSDVFFFVPSHNVVMQEPRPPSFSQWWCFPLVLFPCSWKALVLQRCQSSWKPSELCGRMGTCWRVWCRRLPRRQDVFAPIPQNCCSPFRSFSQAGHLARLLGLRNDATVTSAILHNSAGTSNMNNKSNTQQHNQYKLQHKATGKHEQHQQLKEHERLEQHEQHKQHQ